MSQDKRITELDPLVNPNLSDQVPVATSDETFRGSLGTLRDFIHNNNGLGWARYDDGTYTTGSSFVVTGSGVDIDLPNDGAKYVNRDFMNSQVEFYNTGSGLIQMETEGDVYSMAIALRARTSNTNITHMHIALQPTAGTTYDRVSKTLTFKKGNNVWEDFYESFHFYADSDFVANGNKWRIHAHESDVEIADIIYFIQRTFHPFS